MSSTQVRRQQAKYSKKALEEPVKERDDSETNAAEEEEEVGTGILGGKVIFCCDWHVELAYRPFLGTVWTNQS